MMRVLLVRHGQSEWNATRQLQGQADIALSAQGRTEARALRDTIAAFAPERAVSSDLIRVRETAALIGVADPKLDPDLREISVGDWTGRAISRLIETEKDNYLGWRAGTYRPPGGEAWADFVRRTSGVIEREVRAGGCTNLLVVCHGGVIRAILQQFLKLNPENIIPVAPASLTALRIDAAVSTARLELFNYRAGLPNVDAPD
jgi:probable phosphoglycerate mutase